jgi:hypothetical protein
MIQKRQYINVCLILLFCIGSVSSTTTSQLAGDMLPERLSDQAFWDMTEAISEPNGYFRSDNLLSNEMRMQYVIPNLILRTQPRGAYLGVGPEQNFTYIAALRPRIAFIIDIRRGNLHTHLMYKALFELAPDRADFVSRLFTLKRPTGLGSGSTVQEIFQAYENQPREDEAAFDKNLKAVKELLLARHKFPLSEDDLDGIEYVYRSFYTFGPDISYNSTGRGSGRRGRNNFSTYADIMMQTDEDGVSRGYLANEENFRVVKELQARNFLIPLVGDFGGPKTIRAAGKYLREKDIVVSAFYLSNVEQYLGSQWDSFCSNVASLPLDERSTFIRSSRGGGGFSRGGFLTSLGNMKSETEVCRENAVP